MATVALTKDTFTDAVTRDGVLVFSQPGALPAASLKQVITAVRELNMDKGPAPSRGQTVA